MKLREIIKIEEKLLKIDNQFKTIIDFNECVLLKRYMADVAAITNIYFELMEEKKHISIDDAYEYNNKLLLSNVEENIFDGNKINDFIHCIFEKYHIQN